MGCLGYIVLTPPDVTNVTKEFQFEVKDKEIVLVGLGSHFELWAAEKLAESEAKAMTENLSDIAAQFNF